MAPKLLCLENPLLDLQAHGNDALLNKYNLKANDAILAGPEHAPLYPELLSLNAVKIAGGAAQNTARGVAYILPAHTVLYIGAVGADAEAETLRAASAAAGLDTEYMVVPEQPTGKCGVVITGANRSLCTDLGAANHYQVAHLTQPKIWAYVESAEFFYVGGFHLTVSPAAAQTLGKEAARKNKPFVLNLSAPFIPVAFKEPLAQTLEYADVVIGNETEAASWAESQGWAESKRGDCKAIAHAIAALPKANDKRKRMVIITQGTEPTLVVKDGGVEEYAVHAIDSAKICDTNGAGDAFAGGFMAGLVEGKDVRTCVDMGQWLARLSIQELGPSYVVFLLCVAALLWCDRGFACVGGIMGLWLKIRGPIQKRQSSYEMGCDRNRRLDFITHPNRQRKRNKYQTQKTQHQQRRHKPFASTQNLFYPSSIVSLMRTGCYACLPYSLVIIC